MALEPGDSGRGTQMETGLALSVLSFPGCTLTGYGDHHKHVKHQAVNCWDAKPGNVPADDPPLPELRDAAAPGQLLVQGPHTVAAGPWPPPPVNTHQTGAPWVVRVSDSGPCP